MSFHNINTLLCFWLTVISLLQPLQATTFNPLTSASLESKTSLTGLLTDDGHFIFYRDLKPQAPAIISLNLTDLTETVLLTYDQSQIQTGSEVIQLPNGQLLLVTKTAINNTNFNNSQLFVSADNAPFVAITENNLERPALAHLVNGFYFAETEDGAWVWTNGTSTQTQVFTETIKPLCAFGVQQFIYAAQISGNWKLYVFEQGNSTPVFVNLLSQAHDIETAHTQNACIINMSRGNGEPQPVYFHRDSSSFEVDRHDAKVYAMDDRFVAITQQTNPTHPQQIETLDDQNLVLLNSYSFSGAQFSHATINPDRLLLFFNQSSSQQNLLVLDQELTPLGTTIPIKTNQQIISTANFDVLVGEDAMSFYAAGAFQHQILLNRQLGHEFYSNKQTDDLLYELINKDFYEPLAGINLFKLSDYPSIGQQLNGPWYDVRFQDQGLSINPGQRADGTYYVFLTYFLYRNGKPLWLAGTENYQPGQADISIDLFEFSGADFIDPNTTPERTEFGTINLSFNGCDRLSATVGYDNQIQRLILQRVDDTSFNHQCVSP